MLAIVRQIAQLICENLQTFQYRRPAPGDRDNPVDQVPQVSQTVRTAPPHSTDARIKARRLGK
jgi:predicted signal transduction protein with EAL and GGDEF domain